MSYHDVAESVHTFFSSNYPSRYWIIYVYDNIQGESINSWRCKYCFAALNVNSSFNILMGSIDKKATPNTDLINDPYFNNINNYVNQANLLVDDWFNYQSNSNCLMGVFATSGNYVGAVAGLIDFKGIRILQSTT